MGSQGTKRWSRKKMTWTIVITALLSLLAAAVAMNFATPEKKIERHVPHRYGVRDPQFLREIGVLLGPAVIQGNQVKDLQNGEEIFPSMLEAISQARHTITFETYIYWSGTTGKRFADALSERARAGVKVHMLVDWVGAIKMEQSLLDEMEKAGVEVHKYRPLRWYNIGRLNNRTHRKLLVVDGHIAFTGGVGIADQWSGKAQDPEHWRDVHFRVEGPVAAQFQAAFNDNWIKTTGEVLSGHDYFPALEPEGGLPAHLFIASPAGGSESMHLMYLLAIAGAEQSIDLQAAYFVPDDLALDALLAARERGVRIRIMVPGPHIDSFSVKVASKSQWGPLLRAGIEFFEYQPTMMHSKVLVVDGFLVSVGSTNFDVRSFRLNDEASLNVYDTEFAKRMLAVFEQDLRHAKPYTLAMWNQRPWRQRIFEAVIQPIESQL